MTTNNEDKKELPGYMYYIHEYVPELMYLPKGATILPSGKQLPEGAVDIKVVLQDEISCALATIGHEIVRLRKVQ